MKKKNIFILIGLVMLLLTACSGGRTVKKREEVKEMAEAFFKDLVTADPIKMSVYYNDVLSHEFAKSQDRMYVNQIEAGYDYYMFMEDGVKYLISDDRTLFEDDAMYDMSADTIDMMLRMNVLGYLDVEDDSISYSATNKNDKELTVVININNPEQGSATVTTVSKKNDDGSISEIASEIKDGENVIKSRYVFSYGEDIVLPEYNKPVTYDNMPHVESPYKTFGEIISKYNVDERPMYFFNEEELVMIDSLDDRHYQFLAKVDQETLDAYSAIDFMADDADQQVYDLISAIEIDDCIDFTDIILSRDVLDSYVDKTIQTLVDDGFEISGYSPSDEFSNVVADKDMLTYNVEVIVPEDFDTEADFEYDDLGNFIVKNIEFVAPEYAVLPMR